jgi:hypothetical protein
LADLEGAQNLSTGEEYKAGDFQHTIIGKDAIGSLEVLSSITTIFERLVEGGLTSEEALEAIFGDVEITEADLDNSLLYTPVPLGSNVVSGSQLEKQQTISVTAKVLTSLVESEAVGVEKTTELLSNDGITIDPNGGSNLVSTTSTDAAIAAGVTEANSEAAEAINREQETEAGIPIAVDDEVALDEALGRNAAGDAHLHTTVEGNVTDNDINEKGETVKTVSAISHTGSTAADKTESTTVTNGSVGTALQGAYGTLTINSDGTYSYVANADAANELVDGEKRLSMSLLIC